MSSTKKEITGGYGQQIEELSRKSEQVYAFKIYTRRNKCTTTFLQ
jgi:hypothetical protein